MIGIYKITNKLNGKSYIGQSIHCGKRLDEHYKGNFTEYTVLIGEHIYEVSFFTTKLDEETGDILEERMEYYYLQSLEEYQEEQEGRKNRIGGWEF